MGRRHHHDGSPRTKPSGGKLLGAYYAGAIDVTTLKSEQARTGADIQAAKDHLGDLDANLGEWQEIVGLATTFATRCADAYAKASDRTRRQFTLRCSSAST